MWIVVVSPESRFAGSRFARTKVNSPDDKQHSTTRLYISDIVAIAKKGPAIWTIVAISIVPF